MKGHIAKRYGDLIHEIWSGTARTIAPIKLRVMLLVQYIYLHLWIVLSGAQSNLYLTIWKFRLVDYR